MKEHHYVFFGLGISSTIALPELGAFEQPHGISTPDVHIRLEPLASSDASQETNDQIIRPDFFYFHVPDIASYCVCNGKEIIVIPQRETVGREIRLFLLGSAWSALCYQRGFLPMHAGIVKAEDGGLALCGPSGEGKSTLLAWLVRRGYRVVSDDLCRFDLTDNKEAIAWPGVPRLKLWKDALEAMGHSSSDLDRDHFRHDKFHLPWPADEAPAPFPLRAILLLSWGELGLIQTNGVAALKRFIASAAYRGDLLEPMGILPAYWQRCAELLRRVPVFILSRPRDWAFTEATLDLITTKWPHGG